MVPKNHQSGREAEEFVVRCLIKHGWALVDRNFSRRGTEIDIIALRSGVLAFVEVKYRRCITSCSRRPVLADLFPAKKRKAIMRGIARFCAKNGDKLSWILCRVDLAIVYPENRVGKTSCQGDALQLVYLKNVMEARWGPE